jgi:hypothetical protein
LFDFYSTRPPWFFLHEKRKPHNTAGHLNLDLVLNPGIMNPDEGERCGFLHPYEPYLNQPKGFKREVGDQKDGIIY